MHVRCALLSGEFAKKNVKQQGCPVVAASRSLEPSTLGTSLVERAAVCPATWFSSPAVLPCGNTVDPLCVTDELLAAVTTTLHCVSVECGTNPGPN